MYYISFNPLSKCGKRKKNPFLRLVHIAHHTVKVGHARNPYINRKEGDIKGRGFLIWDSEEQDDSCEQLNVLYLLQPFVEMRQKKKEFIPTSRTYRPSHCESWSCQKSLHSLQGGGYRRVFLAIWLE
ncbi:hypothetical protein VNO77_21995 [Canavalia gladiata]|uniref:Uncharacterized protein n=1 Tax=Canavalia gladiata TaxID=3824 RepID=A0AAN9QAD8_CANGL